jgi:hypothetical protein
MNLAEQPNFQPPTLNVQRSMSDVERLAAPRPGSLFSAECHIGSLLPDRAAAEFFLPSDMFAKEASP